MGIFDEAKPAARPGKFQPYYRVCIIDRPDSEYDHEPGCTIEAVAVGNTAHYVVKKPDGRIDGMYPISSVEAIELVNEPDEEEE
jgi:hypothetical protein